MRNGFFLCAVFLACFGVSLGEGDGWYCWPYGLSLSGLRGFSEAWLRWDSLVDITGNGRVDMRDFGVLTSLWGGCGGPAGAAVHEGYRRVVEVLGSVEVPGTTLPEERFEAVVEAVSAVIPLGAENSVDLGEGRSYWARFAVIDNDSFELAVVGVAEGAEAEVRVIYTFGVRSSTIFDYGIATKGPLQIMGNILLGGTNIAVEANVYIESENNNNALTIIGNVQIAGEVYIVNPDAVVTLQGGQAGIGGETGQDAIDNHVEVGVPCTDFPVPNTSHFEQYVTGDTIDSDTDVDSGGTYENVRITAGTNPIFSGDVTINGIMFIETPNVVIFSGGCDINGLIIGDGDMNDNSGDNQLIFLGNVGSTSVTELPADSQFDGLREETGTFLMVPGFVASLGGSFDTLHGAIAANGITFFGNAGGTIAGSVLNYSDEPMVLSANNDLFLNRSGITEVPAGFEQDTILHRDDTSYCEFCPLP